MADGFIDLLSDDERELVLRGSSRITYPAGTVAHPARERRWAAVVESGLGRIFVASADGRQASVAYLHPGDTYGALEVLGPPPPVALQAVTETAVLLLDAANLNGLAESNPSIARATTQTVAQEYSHLVRIITVRSLGSMTQRLAFDLLERASRSQIGQHELMFEITHEQLADSIGSTREVVTRLLGQLKRVGILTTAHGQIHVLDAVRLSLLVRGLVT